MKSALSIGFDVSQTGDFKAGCGYFADAMIRAFLRLDTGHRFRLFTSFGDFFFDRTAAQAWPASADFDLGPHHRSIQEAAAFWLAADLDERLSGAAILHANNFWCPRQCRNTRIVYTMYDLSFFEFPEWTTEANRVGCFHGIFAAVADADFVIAISQSTRDHFLKFFPAFPQDRVRVIYPCSRFDPSQRGGRLPGRLANLKPGKFWLSVGTMEPRKNQERLAQAYAAYLQAGGAQMPLVFAGGTGWMMGDFLDRLRRLGVADRIVLTGYVSDDELIWLYRNCFAHVYASLYEGFGLPVLEGMQFGAPTIAADSTSIPEIAGTAAILVDPLDSDQIKEAMLRLGRDAKLRRKLSNQARQRAATFRWEKSARQLLNVYSEVMAAPKRRELS